MLRSFHSTIIALVALLVASEASACKNPPQPKLPTASLEIETARGAFPFTVELAVSDEEKACGLMLRQKLLRDQGMLFRNDPPGAAYFWMKNTPHPLDMIFLDPAGRVLHVATFTTPYTSNTYGVDAEVAGILEVAAGVAARLAIRVGDRVRHPWFESD